MKERRICQSLIDTYCKMRKSQMEFALMRHTELVVQKPPSFVSVKKDEAPIPLAIA